MPSLSLLASSPFRPSQVWTADALASPAGTVRASGHAELDAHLPGGGWPVGAMVEILQPEGVHVEWRLLLPALAAQGTGPVLLVGPPWQPFGPALAAQGLAWSRLVWCATQAPKARLWACEQALRCAEVAAVLAWLPRQVRAEPLRRLQLAAAQHAKLLFVMRPAEVRDEASPSPLRLQVAPEAGTEALAVEILKRRGPPLGHPLAVPARRGRLAAMLARYTVAAPAAWRAPRSGSVPVSVPVPGLRVVVGGVEHAAPALGRMAAPR